MTQSNLGSLYTDRDDFIKAEAAYQKALKVYKRLAKANPHYIKYGQLIVQKNSEMVKK